MPVHPLIQTPSVQTHLVPSTVHPPVQDAPTTASASPSDAPSPARTQQRPHLRLLPAPVAAPAPLQGRRGPGPGQAALDLEFTVGAGVSAEPGLPPRLVLVTDDGFGRQPTSRRELPPAGMWVARLAVALVEAMHGQRPSSQLVRWTTQEVLAGLRRQASARAQHPSALVPHRRAVPARRSHYAVASLRVEEPADGIVEATVLLTGPGRPLPLAMRLEGLDGRWICTVADTPDAAVTGTAPTFWQRCYDEGA